MPLFYEMSIQELKGIGEKSALLYGKLGINSVGDLMRFYPRDYEDWSKIQSIADAPLNEVAVIRGKVLYTPSEHRIPGKMVLYKTKVTDEESDLSLTFFNNRYIKSLLEKDRVYLFKGRVQGTWIKKEMLSPAFLSEKKAASIQPVYPLTKGLTSRKIQTSVKNALNLPAQNIQDPLPQKLRELYDLCSLEEALRNVHFPQSEEDLSQARYRLIFEEFLVLQLGMMQIKEKRKTPNLHPVPNEFPKEFESLLPFSLTGAQKRAIAESVADMAGETPMNRLIQGDVGSGKTAVAAALCKVAADEKMQTAFMAPTEILAQQHYHSLSVLLESVGIKTALLTASVTAKNKRILIEELKNGEIDLIIGTHALIGDKVEFQNLGLVITDEQHRFGVGQRAALARKGKAPHLLVMSATPIPRTLALLMYGDLDVSILDELPPGRQEIETYLIDSKKRNRAFGYVKKHLQEGRQGYLICPLIELEEQESGMMSIEEYTQIVQQFFTGVRIGILHGKMKAAEKDEIMQKFSQGEIQLLIATTVVEVGVDVPNAVIMLIENAERYGLSQLHQLRGRVGRGRHKSTCIMISDVQAEETQERLKIMCGTRDGFRIAEEDLRLRGPGDFFGTRQHGLPEMKIADRVSNMDVLLAAQQCASALLKSGEYQGEEYSALRAETRLMFSKAGNDGILN